MTKVQHMTASRPSLPAGRGAVAPRSERTRGATRDAANAPVLEHGVHATSVDAICAAAGVSKVTFYLYFHRKEDLLLEYGLQRLRRSREMLPELIGQKTFRQALNAILDQVVRGKEWGREVTGRALLEMGTGWEGLPVDAPHRPTRA